MAFNSIGNTAYGSQLKEALNSLIFSNQQLIQLQSVMNNMINGGSYATIESNFGFATGSGQPVFNLISAAVTNSGAPLANAAVSALITQVG